LLFKITQTQDHVAKQSATRITASDAFEDFSVGADFDFTLFRFGLLWNSKERKEQCLELRRRVDINSCAKEFSAQQIKIRSDLGLPLAKRQDARLFFCRVDQCAAPHHSKDRPDHLLAVRVGMLGPRRHQALVKDFLERHSLHRVHGIIHDINISIVWR